MLLTQGIIDAGRRSSVLVVAISSTGSPRLPLYANHEPAYVSMYLAYVCGWNFPWADKHNNETRKRIAPVIKLPASWKNFKHAI